MITNNGKEIISRYLLGQVPSFATHLAIGCGAKPLDANDPLPNNLYAKEVLDFEMTRVPISSKGFVDDSQTYVVTYKQLVSNVATLTTSVDHDIVAGETIIVSGVDSTFNGQFKVIDTPTSTTITYSLTAANVTPAILVDPAGTLIVSRTKMSLTAELPTDNRYNITEIGIWSAGSNSLANQYDSRIIFNFIQSWQTHSTSISEPPVNTNLGYDVVTASTDSNIHDNGQSVFYANTNDAVFQVNQRKDRKEGPRHLNRTLMVKGNLSTISPVTGGAWNTADKLKGDWVGSGTHIHLNNINFNISGNNTSDLLKLAFSLVDTNAVAMANVNDVKILMEFFKNEVNTTSGFAKAQIHVPGSILSSNRYYVANWQLSQNIDYSNEAASYSLPYTRFYASPDFASSEIRICRIFVDVTETSEADGSHYIAFDGFRIDNTTENPVYKMSGYSVVKNDGYPITKSANTNNYIDFRFAIGVS